MTAAALADVRPTVGRLLPSRRENHPLGSSSSLSPPWAAPAVTASTGGTAGLCEVRAASSGTVRRAAATVAGWAVCPPACARLVAAASGASSSLPSRRAARFLPNSSHMRSALVFMTDKPKVPRRPRRSTLTLIFSSVPPWGVSDRNISLVCLSELATEASSPVPSTRRYSGSRCSTMWVCSLNLALRKEIFTFIRARYSVGLMTSMDCMPGTAPVMTWGSINRAHTRSRGAETASVFSISMIHFFCGMQHGFNDLCIAGAAAQIARQPALHFFDTGVRIVLEQVARGHDHAGRAIAALQSAALHETFLQRMERVAPRQAFDRRDLAAVHLRGQHQAGLDHLAVEQYRTGAAHSRFAPALGSGQMQVVAQEV